MKTHSVTIPFDHYSGWDKPDPRFLNDGQHPIPELPMTCVGRLAPYIESFAKSRNVAVDYVAVAHWCAAAGIVGAARQVALKADFIQPAILYVALVGQPGIGKSVALKPIKSLVQTIEREAQRDAGLTTADEAGGRQDPRDFSHRILVGDITTEILSTMFAHCERGFIMIHDELSRFIGNLNRYSGKGDAGFYLASYDGDYTPVDRVKAGSKSAARAWLTILGGIQPDPLKHLLIGASNDGFLSRFLVVWPSPTRAKWASEASNIDYLGRMLRRLRSLKMDADERGQLQPRTLPLSPNAERLYGAWYVTQHDKAIDANGLFAQFLSKSIGCAGRLALILELVDWALSEDGPADGPDEVSETSMRNALWLFADYFEPMTERVYMDAAWSDTERHAIALLKEIKKRKLRRFNATEAKRTWSIQGIASARAQTLHSALAILEEAECIRKIPHGEQRAGRKPNDFLVNPWVHVPRD